MGSAGGRPTIDIGLPVYNGADTIDRAIASIRAQTCADFRLIVSDNASSDATLEIARRHAADDPRLEIVVQPENVGPFENYRTLLQRAEAEYFAFLPSDDWWSPTFLETTLQALTSDPAAVCCVPRTAFYAETGARLYVTASTSSITADKPKDRVEVFLRHPSDCARFYGLHRRRAFADGFEGASFFHAWDWYVVLLELLAGTHLEVPLNLLHRTTAPPDRYANYWRRDNAGKLFSRSPLSPMRHALKAKLAAKDYRAFRPALMKLDARLAREHRADERLGRSLKAAT